MTVTELHIYPVKSCRGIALQGAEVGRLGFLHDRQWMFVDGRGKFQVESNGQTNDLVLTYLDVWTKRGGSWQMVHWHSARLASPPAAPAPAPK